MHACRNDNTNLIFHKISSVCVSQWSFINQSHYWRPFPLCCTARGLAKETKTLCHILHQLLLIWFHQEAFKQAALQWQFLSFTLKLDTEWVMSPVKRQRWQRKRTEGWNNLNKTEGQSNNKMSISPLVVLMLISYFSSFAALCEFGWGRGWF